VLAPFTDFLSMAPYFIYKADKVGTKFAEDAKQYMIKKALHGTDFGAAAISAEDPSLFWLAGDILDAALAITDLALMAAPAARVFRELAPLARAAREVEAGEATLDVLNSTAKRVASQELGLGAKEAGDFAAEVTADARAARTGPTVGETADEAKMLKQAAPQAEDAKVLEEAGSKADEAKASQKATDEVVGEGAGTKTIPAPTSKPLTLDELRQQAAPLRAERTRLAKELRDTETRVQNFRERIDEFEKMRAERRLPPKPEFLEKELEEARAKAANQLRNLEQAEGKLAEVESEIAKQTPPDPSRPSPRQSEVDVGKDLGYKFEEQQSYLNRKPVPYATEGSVRPDWVAKDGSISVEVKNYNIADNSDGLIDNVSKQAIYRTEHLPVGMRQRVVIDIRGQVVSLDQEQAIIKGIVRKSKGAFGPGDIVFKR
jgi:HAMP domain-containing protein